MTEELMSIWSRLSIGVAVRAQAELGYWKGYDEQPELFDSWMLIYNPLALTRSVYAYVR
jgi:hypothetical protein